VRRRGAQVTRVALVYYLGAAAALLSFDALRARALGEHATDADVIPLQAVLPRPVLASVWASVIDVAAAVGILGLRGNRRDPAAWAMFLAAAVASVGFQMFTPWVALGRAVPPVALFLAVVVLELPRARTRDARVPEDFPEPVVPLDAPDDTGDSKRPPHDAPMTRPATGPARERVRQLLSTEDPAAPMTAKQAADLTGVSRGRAGALLKQERLSRASTNGHKAVT
jgi:hypothetical protein